MQLSPIYRPPEYQDELLERALLIDWRQVLGSELEYTNDLHEGGNFVLTETDPIEIVGIFPYFFDKNPLRNKRLPSPSSNKPSQTRAPGMVWPKIYSLPIFLP